MDPTWQTAPHPNLFPGPASVVVTPAHGAHGGAPPSMAQGPRHWRKASHFATVTTRPDTMTARTPSRVALLEDEPAMRQRLLHALSQDSLLTVAWSGDSVRACQAWLMSHTPDVLLVDLGLPDGSGIEVIDTCRRLHPECDVMVVTLFADDASLLEAFAAGASGYLLKDGSERELLRHVRDLRSGGSPMSPMIARRLLQHWQRSEAAPGMGTPAARQEPHDDPPAGMRALHETSGTAPGAAREVGDSPLPAARRPMERLTVKESTVLGLIARGFTYDETAQRMALSAHTVRTHVRNIYAKLDVHNKAEAVYQARALGWLE